MALRRMGVPAAASPVWEVEGKSLPTRYYAKPAVAAPVCEWGPWGPGCNWDGSIMNKFAALFLGVLAVIGTLLLGWGLVYLPGTMSASAQRAIEDFQRVLARDARHLTLTHGSISANPLTASVSVADVSLSHTNGDAIKAAALEFTVDPFSGEISALDAQALSFDKDKTETRIAAITLSGLTSETRGLLDLAARGELTLDAVTRRLEIAELRLRDLTVTTPNHGEMSLKTLALENMEKGIIGRFVLEDLNAYIRSSRNPGEVVLGRMELTGLNFAEIVAAARRPGLMPVFTAPVIKRFTFERFELRAKDVDIVFGRGESDAIYAENDLGRPYARKMTFLMDEITMKPRGNSPGMEMFLRDSGLAVFKARFNMVSTGDHAKRTMAIEEMSLRMTGLADIEFKIGVGNLPKAAFELSVKAEEVMGLMTEVLDATLIDGSLVVSNTRLIQVGLAQAAKKQGIDAKAMMLAMLRELRRNAGSTGSAFFKTLADELEKFLNDPKVLKISVAPAPPLPFHRMQRLTQGQGPGPLIGALNLKVEANR